jgi:heme/copper-type cytochrome/quinol oxidase subunit 4
MAAGSAHDVGPAGEERAQAPIRWPRPDKFTLGLIVAWLVGLVVALAVPAFIVPPTAQHPSTGQTWFAFAFTLIGALIMLTVSTLHYRREHEFTVATMATVCAIAVVVGGIILVATKLGGGFGQGG